MNIPLYNSHNAPTIIPGGAHKGLWFERFFHYFDSEWKIPATFYESGKEKNPKFLWVSSVKNKCGPDDKTLQSNAMNQLSLVGALNGENQCYRTDWHFVTGLGNPHPVENGFSWHPTLGVPYLPGAAIKGMLRAWMEEWIDEGDRHAQQCLCWFGSKPSSRDDEYTGGLIFFDALPIEQPSLTVDVMTPHMGKWYAKGDSEPNSPETLPADWHDPIPVPFLVVKEASFLFSVCVRPGASDNETLQKDLPMVLEMLKDALEWIGAGAKTAVGYGRMLPESFEGELAKKHKNVEKQKRTRQLAVMSDFKRSVAKIEDAASAENKPSHLALLKALEANAHPWSADEKDIVARSIRDVLIKENQWCENTRAKNPGKDKKYQRTLTVISFLKGDG